MPTPTTPEPPTEVPPIVLLVDRRREELETYSRCLEDAGLWVAATSHADEAVATAEELRLDIIVAEAGDVHDTLAVVAALKDHPALGGVPVIVITSAPETQAQADSVLIRPVPPSLLLERTNQLLSRSRKARQVSQDAIERGHHALQRASVVLRKVAEVKDQIPRQRTCPDCDSRLEWVEQGLIGGATYDYYRWCLKGCGLYCFDRDRAAWVKLA